MLRLSLILLAIPTLALAQEPLSLQAGQKLAQASFGEYLQLLALPNDAINPPDIQKNIDFLERAFTQRGFVTKQLANKSKPMLFAEWPKKIAGAKTVLYYMHLDGQPVVDKEWSQPSPWQPVVKKRDSSNNWHIIPTEALFATPLDPDLRVFARASSDDKGPIMMLLAAFDGLKQMGVDPAFNVKVLLDSEEEQGYPSIPDVVTASKHLLHSDAIVIHDGPRHQSERPTLIFGNRGSARVTLVVHGPKQPLHSGHFGNYVPNPAVRLSRLIASMKDDQGRVTVAGYYDRITLSDAEKQILADTGDDEAAIRRSTGIKLAELVGGNLQEAIQFPSLNVRSMAAASVGEKASNIIPHQAIAEFDLRTTPEAPPNYLFGLLKAHIEQQGYRLVDGAPSDQDRAAYDKLATLTLGSAGRAVRTPLESPLGKWAYQSLQKASLSGEPVRIRMMGGSVPTDSLVEMLGAPFVIVPLVNGDNNQHTFDENLRVGHYVEGVRTIVVMLQAPPAW
ncbi:succinyl-diaminopimelate desuccinylase [Luteitalea pratensis]|uniref:Succinyl-diaminopimelate desuccinylase n=1 Tax=Luteitalea pratensis TaxID=1855912 RepID=A0A143PN85_LUTPR|nr:succinyl-diaminopimelate desuccinylase [Luteitalea pratensis]